MAHTIEAADFLHRRFQHERKIHWGGVIPSKRNAEFFLTTALFEYWKTHARLMPLEDDKEQFLTHAQLMGSAYNSFEGVIEDLNKLGYSSVKFDSFSDEISGENIRMGTFRYNDFPGTQKPQVIVQSGSRLLVEFSLYSEPKKSTK